jgi:sulfite reductase beta subunit-like hemoprotein
LPTVKEVGYLEFRKLLQERYGKSWMQWIMGVCPDGMYLEEAVLMVDLDETAAKLGWIPKTTGKNAPKLRMEQ